MRRKRRKVPSSKHLSLSMTDEDWGVVRANAARDRLSMARYVVELVNRAARTDADEPTLSLDAGEQRELIETVRTLPALIQGNEDAPALIRDMQIRIAAVLDIWALDMLREGRRDELRAVLASRVGADQTDLYVGKLLEGLPPLTPPPPTGNSGRRPTPGTPSGQGKLFC